MTTRGLVTFSCLHSATFAQPLPLQGDTVLCRQCDKAVKVLTAQHNYHWVCDTCRTGREYGGAYVTAETRATSHALRRVGHRVRFLDGEDQLAVIHHEPMPIEIPF